MRRLTRAQGPCPSCRSLCSPQCWAHPRTHLPTYPLIYLQVHMQFSVLGLERTYVTFAGSLLGVIRRSQLGGR